MAPHYARLRAVMAPGRRQWHPPSKRPALTSSRCHRYRGPSANFRCGQRRDMSVYGFGQQWTGALSRGPSDLFSEEALEISSEEIQQFGECQSMVPLKGVEDKRCVSASVGWGHTALIVTDKTVSNEANSDNPPKLMVCGRPHDFQSLMRLRRMPPFIRNFCVKYTLPDEQTSEDPSSPPSISIMQKMASYLAGENEVTFHEEECRRYSNVPTLLEMDLPSGEIPALEGDIVDKKALETHAAARVAQEDGRHHNKPLHTHFQNTLATSAGVTAVISESGTLYAFGLNHRGQCGSGSFALNMWNPTGVAGLASTRFILDHSTETGEDMFRKFKEQEFPIVSVALGLQHGVALDAEGQVFCWGKGERGQLGQGRRMAYEGYEGEEGFDNQDIEEDEPNQNRTFEYALQVANFYDPFVTTTPSPNEIFAPLLSKEDSKVRLISAGMNFTLAVTESNLPYIWGKNISLNPDYSESDINIRSKPVQDSPYPRYISGLPHDLRIEKVACGTHHAAILLEDGSIWAVGVATDTPVPLWDEAVEILAPGLVEMDELVSFTAGFDRTVVVAGSGKEARRQVIEVQLWSNEELRQQGAVRPTWLDWLETQERVDTACSEKVCSVHRGWMHSVVVTEEG